MSLRRKLKIALDENRLMVLGTQVLFGFQFNGIFQDMFQQLPMRSKLLECSGLTLLMIAIALLIAPAMEHRIAERGEESSRVLDVATTFAGWALVPFSFAVAVDFYVVTSGVVGPFGGWLCGAGFFAVAILLWYGLAFSMQRTKKPRPETRSHASVEAKVEQLLTESRIIIPGCQALLGFQLTVMLTSAFSQLPWETKMVHLAALGCVGLAVILLMAPASLHRIAFNGEDDPEFVRIGSWFVVAAPLPLAFGIALDTFVAAGQAVQSQAAAIAMAVIAILVLVGVWYAYPIFRRLTQKSIGL
jgi:hypothetical protein